jgi:hypothetical protein
MIGIGRSDPELALSLDPFWERVQETIAWCRPRLRTQDPQASLRSVETRPRSLEPDYFAAVRTVAIGRRQAGAHRVPFRSLEGGRLLVFFPDLDLACGAAEAESRGYFDVNNTPAWDTWVAMIVDDQGGHECPYLVSWVPPELIPLADRGIHVNPEQCILWLNDAKVGLRDLLAAASNERGS